VYRRILGPVYDNEKENWRISTNKEIYAMVEKSTIRETKSLNRLRWFEHGQRLEENRIPPKKVLYMNLKKKRLTGRPRNRWQDQVREDGRLLGGKGWKERVYNREEWKKLQRMAKNRILHMQMESTDVVLNRKLKQNVQFLGPVLYLARRAKPNVSYRLFISYTRSPLVQIYIKYYIA